ncbi:hypothetical protein JRG42_12830 [Pseudomonas granadensis]|uniref:Uncharacterized protein n=1 Tax=Pseudomonas granadensis TaxID=1421430 RepID=A0ABX7GK11_9PSED|nr:hypothetical protein [Pseudomonas granadensis]MBN6774825.1 hypothetical protein [Pseudomonas granadensis]MBN6805375.1 hypothetical protein [Pseudomonas granadensis]MBN6832851.1 hypothetical protein [Pseudomonas granadensis]MBN6839569.1 hypothetical protein [Pseudomonas granadensis]MBN6868944.1 hypothetical protein [Pseudomonas granadensis]
MNITITKIIRNSANETQIEYSSDYGTGVSKFIGPPPKKDQALDVEIDINDNFYWGKNLATSKKKAPSIYYNNGKTFITAELLTIEDDGCGVLKIGDCIALISVEKRNQTFPLFVDMISTDFSFYPNNL